MTERGLCSDPHSKPLLGKPDKYFTPCWSDSLLCFPVYTSSLVNVFMESEAHKSFKVLYNVKIAFARRTHMCLQEEPFWATVSGAELMTASVSDRRVR